jgi:transposase-like protein
MGDIRKRYGSKFKARVALEAIKGEKTAAELASEYAVHVSQITRWKKRVMASLPDVFSEKHEKDRADAERLQEELYKQIGRLKVEVDWLKKKSGLEY